MRLSLSLLFMAVLIHGALAAGDDRSEITTSDPRLEAATPHDPARNIFNPDAIMVDVNPLSATYRQSYAQKWYRLRLSSEAASSAAMLSGSSDNSSTVQLLRHRLGSLSDRFGSFELQAVQPTHNDPLSEAGRSYRLRFAHYVAAQAVIAALNELGIFEACYLESFAGRFMSYPTDPAFARIDAELNDFYQAPTSAEFPKRHRLGWQWHLHQMKAPMAWEITKGKPEMVIGIDDTFDPGHINFNSAPQHPDIVPINGSSGNFLQISAGNQGNGSLTSSPLFDDGHGFQNLTIAVGLENSTGMIGMAPSCRALSTNWATLDYEDLDTDEDAMNGIVTPVAVMNCSYESSSLQGSNERSRFRATMEAGIVVVGGQGNSIYDEDKQRAGFGERFANSECEIDPETQDPRKVMWGRTLYPAGLVYTDPDPRKDFKVISVGVYSDRQRYVFSQDCESPTHQLQYTSDTYPKDWNFAPNFEKFPAAGLSESERQTRKEAAFVDVVTPHNEIAGVSHDTETGAAIPQKYAFSQGGASRSVPAVSGIVALMRSVDFNLGTAGGVDVQRRAYDIITFTADKVLDNSDNFPSDPVFIDAFLGGGWYDYTTTNPVKNAGGECVELQFDYKLQTNDHLQRWWAQRVGFGQVNAFRCLAHAIPHKGDYVYNATQSLAFDPGVTNENGIQLMHMGSWKAAGIAVLDEGGVKYDGEPDYKNNHGVTKINGAGTTLSVGPNKVLAIDGILTSDDPTGGEILAGNDAKILMTGYLDNTKLAGNIQIGDLLINADPGSRAWVKPGSAGRLVEVAGYLRVQGEGEILADAGTLRLQPSGSIYLGGSSDLLVENGATLEMNAGTAILGDEGRKLIVKSGGTLIVKEDARNAAFYCEVVLENGAAMIVEDDAYLVLGPVVSGFFTGDNSLPVGNGTIVIHDGASLTVEGESAIVGGNLINGVYNYDGGEITVESGGQLTIAQNADAGIQVPVTVRAQATMLIDRNAALAIHRFYIAKDAELFIEDGCRLDLTNDDFTAYTSRGRIEFRGTVANRIAVTARRHGDCDDSPAFARIIAFGSATDLEQVPPVLSSWTKIQYSDFNNVQMAVRDNYVTDPIVDCGFYADHDETNVVLNRLLELSNGRLEIPFHSPINIPVVVNNCQFAYADARVVVPDDPNVYPYKGLFSRGINDLQINSSRFENLHYGVSTLACGDVRIQSSQFRSCDIGNIDSYSTVELCTNVFEMVEFASVFEGSMSSGHYNNQYMTVEKAVQLLGGPFQGFRSNLFSEYHQGIVVDESRAELTGWRSPVFNDPNRTLMGRNSFTVLPTAQSANPYIDLAQSKYLSTWTDVALTDVDGQANFRCGWNDMAEHSSHHIHSAVNRMNESIDGSINFWHDPFQPAIGFMRAFNIGTSGGPLNQSDTYGGDCGLVLTAECPTPILYSCAGDGYVNDGVWAELDPADNYLDLARDNARSIMMNTGLPASCRREKAYDAFQAAWLGDERATDLPTLKQEYAQIRGEFGLAKMLAITASMLMGQIDEYFGQTAAAIGNYSSVVANYPSSRSARYAAWRISFLTAEQTDPTLGPQYEQLLQSYYGQVVADLREIDQLPKQSLTGDTKSADGNLSLHANLPNPFSDETELHFTLQRAAQVRLLVTDMMGRVVSTLTEGYRTAGDHSLVWRACNIPAGVYYCRLESDKEKVMRKLILRP